MIPLTVLGVARSDGRGDGIAKPAKRIISALQTRTRQQPSCHTDGPSYNDKGGDDEHNKAGG
jgi:hypothetical protein